MTIWRALELIGLKLERVSRSADLKCLAPTAQAICTRKAVKLVGRKRLSEIVTEQWHELSDEEFESRCRSECI